MTTQPVEPIDPASELGAQVADDLAEVLAEHRVRIATAAAQTAHAP